MAKLTKAELDQVIAKLPKNYFVGFVKGGKKGATKKGFDLGALASLIQVLWAIFQQIKPPKPPKPPDPPVDPPKPPVDPPKPPVDPPVNPPVEPPPVNPPDPQCVRPDGIKLGWRDARKIQPGWRNTFNVTPTIGGVPAPEGCGSFYYETYGEPQAFQSLVGGFQDDPVERASGDSYGCILVLATNSEELWKNGEYQEAGKMTIGVSYPWLRFWRCQDVVMGVDGKITGAGNNSQSYDRPK